MSQSYTISPFEESMRGEIVSRLTRAWGTTRMASLGKVVDAAGLPGLVARDDEELVGILTWHVAGGACELLTLNAFRPREGIGRALVTAFENQVADKGFERVFLITTNDNRPAQRFYEAMGWKLAEVRKGAVDEARRTLKPEIPHLGIDGVPIRDELVYEWPGVVD